MGGRAFRIALLVFQALWLNAIVPGHRRGVVAVPGNACPACGGDAAVACDMAGEGRHTDSSRPAPADPAEHCAICHFAAMLSPPPAFDPAPPALRLLDVLPVPAGDISVSLAVFVPYHGRAPPSRLLHLA